MNKYKEGTSIRNGTINQYKATTSTRRSIWLNYVLEPKSGFYKPDSDSQVIATGKFQCEIVGSIYL